MTAVIINGITAGTGAGTYTVPPAGAISMTYSVAPTWAWSAAGAAPAADFQARLPKGSVVYADSTAGRSGPQLLYQALNALNGGNGLRAYVQGNDDQAHFAGVSN